MLAKLRETGCKLIFLDHFRLQQIERRKAGGIDDKTVCHMEDLRLPRCMPAPAEFFGNLVSRKVKRGSERVDERGFTDA